MQRLSFDTRSGARGSYDPDRYERLSFVAAAAGFRDGGDTPRRFLERCLETMHALEPSVRAFAYVDEDGARRAADASTDRYRAGRPLGPLDGCPFGIKDTIETRDMPTQQNAPLFKGWSGGRDAACVWALRQEGGVILGKTQVPEYAMGKSPPTRNPFDTDRTAGGSSSGSGASVGARMVPCAIGNQTMASLIRPSSFNAVYGFKPTWGALNIGGMHPLAPSQDHIGPMAATLADAWVTARRIAEQVGGHNGHGGLDGPQTLPESRKPARLVRLDTLGWSQVDDSVRELFERFIAGVAATSVEIVDRRVSAAVEELERMLVECDDFSTDIVMYEARWPFLAYIDAYGRERAIGDTAYARLQRGIDMTPDDYRRALAKRTAARRKVAEVAAGADGFITLASSGPAPFVERPNGAAGAPDRAGAHMETGSRSFVSPWTMIGGPALALPYLAVDGMPLGIQLMGVPDSDADVFSTAHWLDQAVAGE
jgi:Asp-tRNA(Asn)/Glu-tRNA(Gln) amidotransferase A subunit family amidase